jgi:hypothetical protein
VSELILHPFDTFTHPHTFTHLTHHHTPSHTITHHHTPSNTIIHHHTPSHTITHTLHNITHLTHPHTLPTFTPSTPHPTPFKHLLLPLSLPGFNLIPHSIPRTVRAGHLVRQVQQGRGQHGQEQAGGDSRAVQNCRLLLSVAVLVLLALLLLGSSCYWYLGYARVLGLGAAAKQSWAF